MRRRSFLGRLAVSVAALATACAAPPAPRRMLRIGGIGAEAMPADGSRPLQERDIMEGLRRVGFVPGENLAVEWRHAEGDSVLFALFADEFVAARVDVIIAATGSAAQAAKAATSTIPIVMVGAGDPVQSGLVGSLAHPGGNITGTAFSNTAEGVKRVELLHEAFPSLTRALVIDPLQSDLRRSEMQRTASSLGLELSAPVLRTDDDVRRSLDDLTEDSGMVLMGHTLTFRNTPRITAFAAARRIATVYSRKQDVVAGGLMSYGSDRREVRLAAGTFVRRIADGAMPADLPIQTPEHFELVANLITAKSAGWAIPASVLAMATGVIR